MTRPSSLPRWADVGGAIVVPSSGKLDVGHVPAERSPAQYENWWKNLAYQHLAYLDEGIHNNREHWLLGSAFEPNQDIGETDDNLLNDGEWWSSTSFAYELDLPLGDILRVGDRIREIRVYGVAGDAGGEILTVSLYRRGGATGAPTQVSTTKTSAATSGQANVAWTLGDTDFGADGHVVVAGAYYLQANMPVTSSAGEVKYYAIKIVFDRPEL